MLLGPIYKLSFLHTCAPARTPAAAPTCSRPHPVLACPHPHPVLTCPHPHTRARAHTPTHCAHTRTHPHMPTHCTHTHARTPARTTAPVCTVGTNEFCSDSSDEMLEGSPEAFDAVQSSERAETCGGWSLTSPSSSKSMSHAG
jgi:hypothetical protein